MGPGCALPSPPLGLAKLQGQMPTSAAPLSTGRTPKGKPILTPQYPLATTGPALRQWVS